MRNIIKASSPLTTGETKERDFLVTRAGQTCLEPGFSLLLWRRAGDEVLKFSFYFLVLLTIFITSCNRKEKKEDDTVKEVKTPVTVTSPQFTAISENFNLNATSSYLKKNQVNSNINGFIVKLFAAVGDYVSAGKPLFIIKTKEADAISKLNAKDSLFSFKGEYTVNAPVSGVLTQVNRQINDYVADGETLATIADQNSLVFLLNIPFELNKYATMGTACNIILPDSTTIKGVITSKLEAVDATSQTQSYVVKPETNASLPENLLATAQLTKSTKPKAQVIDKACILTDEAMENFWVMKLINDSTAIKVPVKKGISEGSKIEILSPQFTDTDRLLSSGNYGLPDTAKITVTNK